MRQSCPQAENAHHRGCNARGAVGILLADLAPETQLINEPLIVVLVVMAMVTSTMAGPMIRALNMPNGA